MKINKF